MYQGYLSKTLENIRRDASSTDATDRFGPQDEGAIYFTVNETFANDVESLDYFTVDYRFFREDTRSNVITNYPRNSGLGLVSVASLDAAAIYPNVWIPADTLVKSFRSVILTDLGQLDEKKTGPNILTIDSLLEHFTVNFSITAGVQANAPPGPAREQYSLLRNTTGTLGTTPSVIRTKYLCQVPRRKSVGTIIYGVIVAVLVFMQFLLVLLNWIVATFVMRSKDGEVLHYCLGCTQTSSTILPERSQNEDKEASEQNHEV